MSTELTYQDWLAALDAAVLAQIERYNDPVESKRLGFLYNSTLAEELAGFYLTDEAVDVCLGDFDMGLTSAPYAERQQRLSQVKMMLAGKPRGTWVNLIWTYHAGKLTRFAMATGDAVPYIQDSGEAYESYAVCRARLLESETYHSRCRCDEILAARADALHAGRWPVGTTLRNLRFRMTTYSTCTVTKVEPREIKLEAKKRGTAKRWLFTLAPRMLAAAVAEAAA